jgi:predicted transcriptional regulator
MHGWFEYYASMREIIVSDEPHSDTQAIQHLTELGFSEGEATAYVFLLQHSPATGYRVARSIGRSFSNAYQILESLERRGAVLVEAGDRRLYRALPIEELLDQIERAFKTHRRQAEEALKDVPARRADLGIYELKTVAAVYEHCLRMLKECEERALVELFPEPLEVLEEAVRETAARGVVVAARVHGPAELNGVHLILSPYASENLRVWRAQWLTLYVDGRQYLQANLMTGGGGVHHAVWSENPYLSRALYSYVNSDFHHYAFRPQLQAATSVDQARQAYEAVQRVFPVGGDLGYRDLLGDMAAMSQNGAAGETATSTGG